MRICRSTILAGVLAAMTGFALYGQEASAPPAPPSSSGAVFKSESRLVLVDAVVTDKKGAYIHDLTAKDFKVFEDNKEQEIKSFAFQADPASPLSNRKRYVVLFFDYSTMQLSDQVAARQAAAKFIDNNSGNNRYMAVVNFGGSLQIAQNFTNDAEKLKKVVTGLKIASVSTASPGDGGPNLGQAEMDFGVRDSILALRSLAKSLGSVPGRKTLVLFTSGFPVDPEYFSEVTAAIDACNKANVAIYPIDVRGLVAGLSPYFGPTLGTADGYSIVKAAYSPMQRGGSVGGGGGHGGGGGSVGGGSRGGGAVGSGGGKAGGTGGGARAGSVASPGLSNNINSPFNQPRSIIPPFPQSASTNQEIMYMLANGTGGFVILNTNDLFGGLEKILKETDEYYVMGYTPKENDDGSCHTIKVKVDRGGANVRARSGYCDVKGPDVLSGKPEEKALENRASAASPGNVAASMQIPFFYTSPNVARVSLSMDIPATAVEFAKTKGKLHSAMNVMGIAYKPDGAVAAKFSDTVKLDLDNKKELETFQEKPLHYENQFEIASGTYTLKVVFSASGQSFGKLEAPLVVEPYDGKQFSVSGVAFSKDVHKISESDLSRDAALLENRVPLVTEGLQMTPAGTNHFKKGDQTFLYLEVYEPLMLAKTAPSVAMDLKVLDKKTGQQKDDSGLMNLKNFMKPGSPVIPVGMKLPLDKLAPGSYLAEFKAVDSAGKTFVRSTNFEVE